MAAETTLDAASSEFLVGVLVGLEAHSVGGGDADVGSADVDGVVDAGVAGDAVGGDGDACGDQGETATEDLEVMGQYFLRVRVVFGLRLRCSAIASLPDGGSQQAAVSSNPLGAGRRNGKSCC